MNKLKKLVWGLFAVVLIAVAAVWMLGSGIEPIPDTNGPDDFSLTTITDENIIALDRGALDPVTIRQSGLTIGGLGIHDAVEFSSQGFSGVYELFYNNYVGKSDVEFQILDLKVDSGNFKMVVLLDDEIVQVIQPSAEPVTVRLEDVSGTVSLRIGGESAAYSFAMSWAEYDHFAHP